MWIRDLHISESAAATAQESINNSGPARGTAAAAAAVCMYIYREMEKDELHALRFYKTPVCVCAMPCVRLRLYGYAGC